MNAAAAEVGSHHTATKPVIDLFPFSVGLYIRYVGSAVLSSKTSWNIRKKLAFTIVNK